MRSLGRWLTGAQRAHPLSPTHIATRSEELQTAAAASSVPGLASRQWADTGPYGPVSGGSCLIAPQLGLINPPALPSSGVAWPVSGGSCLMPPPLVAHQSPHHHLFPSPPLISRPLHGHTRAGAHASGRAGERGPKRLTKISTHPHLLRHTRRRLGFSGSEAATEIREVSKPPFTRKIRQGEEIREGESPLTAAFHSQDPTRRRDPRRRARPEAAFDVAARSWPGAPGQPSGTCTHPPHRPGPARPGTGCVCVCLNTQYKSI